MKTFRILGMALVAVMLGFAMSACSGDNTTDRIVAGEFDTFILPGFVEVVGFGWDNFC